MKNYGFPNLAYMYGPGTKGYINKLGSHVASSEKPSLTTPSKTPYVSFPYFLSTDQALSYFSLPSEQQFLTFPSHGTHKLITKLLRHTKNMCYIFVENYIGIILIHSHHMAIVMLAVVIFLFDNLRKKEVSAPD